ncbi:DUF401 family protein [Desulfonatronovibrio magnus]|uniref:DUF401 family protein n=1 Tax=Desulfonatronovibrio magnus TaxID=698827 RepID=UPI0005EBB004|nr:DUF401 family protein [Desulfonatronovibrio magnus]
MDTASLIPLSKILLVFTAMVLGIKFRLGIGLSILGGSVLTGFLFQIPFTQWILIAVSSLLDYKLVLLAMIVTLIMLLSRILENTGQSKRLMRELSGILPWPKFRLAFFPALIGLLPMPGGAVFSAPMVKTAAQGHGLSGKEKVLINYWFRHVWELIWPLYPGLILAAHLSGIPLVKLLGYTWPGMVICVLLGWYFYLYPIKKLSYPEQIPKFSAGNTFYESFPLLMAIAGSLSLEALVWSLNLPFDPETGLVAGLFIAIVICAVQNKVPMSSVMGYFKEKHLWQMVFVILSIFVFKGILDKGGIVGEISGSISGKSALLAATALLPMIVGLISGITIAFVGSTFPLIIGVVDQLGIELNTAYVVLGLFSGLAGVMVSPIHICFILTCEFFHTNIAKVWPGLFLPSLLLFLSGIVYFFILA